MKNAVKSMIVAVITMLTVMFGSFVNISVFTVSAADEKSDSMTGASKVSVIFTHDMHSHMDGDKNEENGRIIETGGFGRLSTVVKNIKDTYPESFLLDGGDFSMGTSYQTIFSEEAPELRMMGYLGFDATTLGNHEFDYRAEGLASMLEAAVLSGDDIPMILAANIDWEATVRDSELRENAEKLKKACSDYGVSDYAVIEHNGVKAAVFGLMGESAAEYAPESGLIFKDASETAEEVVHTIKKSEDVDMIICLSHCGTIENENDSLKNTEDYVLAEEIPDIDLIISAHTHTIFDEPIKVGETYIVSCGSYNKNVGHVVLERDKNTGRFNIKSYELIPLDENVESDNDIENELEEYRLSADKKYFSNYGYSVGQVIANNDVEFSSIDEFGLVQGEEPLGNLIADSYRYAVKEYTESDVDVAIVPHGVVRGSLLKGDITVSDVFNVSSLGYGKDGKAGYPLVKAYLTGKELKAVAEVDVSISDFMGVARLYLSGLEYSWNPHRLILNRAVDVRYNDGREAGYVEDDKLYSVTADLYSCQMLGAVKDKSLGLLKIEPKDENGDIIEDFEEHIVYAGSSELKAWYALASYIDSFEDNRIPSYYSKTHERKVKIESWMPTEILKQPNKIFFIVTAAVMVLIIVIVIVIRMVGNRIRNL